LKIYISPGSVETQLTCVFSTECAGEKLFEIRSTLRRRQKIAAYFFGPPCRYV